MPEAWRRVMEMKIAHEADSVGRDEMSECTHPECVEWRIPKENSRGIIQWGMGCHKKLMSNLRADFSCPQADGDPGDESSHDKV
jgi:hypothetical protein